MSYNVFTVMDTDLLDGLPERGDRSVHRPGAELGNTQVHDGQAEADWRERRQ